MNFLLDLINSDLFTFTVLAEGLDNPRGLAIREDDTVYVTEAGIGGEGVTIPAPQQGVNLSYGATGAVTRIRDGIQERVLTDLPSLIEKNATTGEIRPNAFGLHDISFNEAGEALLLVGFGASTEFRPDLGDVGTEFGRLWKYEDIDAGSEGQPLVDLAAYEAANNLDGTDVVSNPFDFILNNGEIAVIDSGANTLLGVNETGTTITDVSVFPSRLVNNPFAPDEQIPMQSVPTSITVGPDGAYYVGELTGFPFPEDQARVYRLESPGDEPTVYAEDFTQIIDLEFDIDGNLYVLEYAEQSLLSGNPQGALIQVTPDGTRNTISGEELIFPTALEITPEGDIYVSVNNTGLGNGQVIVYEDTTPEVRFGSPEADTEITVTPTTETQIIFSGAGNDLIDASSSLRDKDRIYAGSDADELFAGTNDRLFGDGGNDILDASVGGGGNRLYGAEGDDELIAGMNDRLFGGDGKDTIELTVGSGGNRAYGGADDDNFFLGSGDTVLGQEGNDRFFVTEGGGNTITGGLGVDAFWVVSGILPSEPNDVTDFDPETDVVGIGGFSEDSLTFSANGNGDAVLIVNGTQVATFLGVSETALQGATFDFNASGSPENRLGEPLLTVADFDGDGTVTATDIEDITSRSDTVMGDDNYHVLYDLNADGSISSHDIAIAQSSLGESSPLIDQQVASATQATMPYYGENGLENAIADGYIPYTAEAKGHGRHYYNPALANQIANAEQLDVERPVGLNFDAKGNLIAVFYIRIPQAQEPTPENPSAGLSVDPADDHPPEVSFATLSDEDWHTHEQAWYTGLGSLNPETVYFEEDVPLELTIQRLENLNFQQFPESDRLYSPKFWMLHGWFHSFNPDGTFAITNPNAAPYAFEELAAHNPDHGQHSSSNQILGTGETEVLSGDAEDNRINGFDGDDTITGESGDDDIWGGFGNDTLEGNLGSDMVYGGPGNDTILGQDGNDRLFGGTEDDVLEGGLGDDILRGGLGNDQLTGDAGSDLFALFPTEGTDTITDFEIGVDRLVLGGGLSPNLLSQTQQESNTILSFGTEDLAILEGINVGDLQADSFLVA